MGFTERKPNRLDDYDYSQNGAYFITVCTKNRRHLLWENVGAIIDRPENVPLTDLGRIVRQSIENIPKHYPAVTVDHYAIMPDHIHLLLQIHTDSDGRSLIAPTISTIVRQMKGAITKESGFSFWQKGFYDHVIRNQRDYDEIWQYIENNPRKWVLQNKG